MRAAALDEVRRGARATLSRASLPGVLNSFAMGQPRKRVTGVANVAVRLVTPRKSRSTPPPPSTMRPRPPPTWTNMPTRNAISPMIAMVTPAVRRRVRIAWNPIWGCIAATGGIFAARRAGMRTDNIVTPIPTIVATITVRGSSTVPVGGNPAPMALNSAMIRRATAMPPKMPIAVPITPIPSASVAIRRLTWVAFAPIARSSASSRSRCPIVIWKTLLMMNAATKAVTKAKMSSPVWKMLMNCPIWSCVSAISSSRSITSMPSGTASWTAALTVASSPSSMTLRLIASTRPSAP